MATINDRFTAINTKLTEASTEILAELEKLRGETLSDEARASLDAIEAKANAMADIVPNTPTPPEAP